MEKGQWQEPASLQVTGAFSREKTQKTEQNQTTTSDSKQMEKNPKRSIRDVVNVEMSIGDEESVQPGKPPEAVSL